MAAKKSPLEQLNDTLSKKKFEGYITTLGAEEEQESKVKTLLPSGILTLDVVLGGGWPIGRVVEVFGHEASGKSLLAALACANAQKAGYMAVYLDSEFAVDMSFFQKLGIDVDTLYYASPNSLEDVFNALEGLIDFKKEYYSQETPMVFVWDSVASTTNADERKRSWEDKGYSTSAIYISQAFRKLKGEFGKHNVLFFLINQTRSNVGVLFGDTNTTYGGKAIKFYSSIRLNLNEESKEKVGEKGQHKRIVGMNLRAEAVKNKIVAPYRSCLLPLNIVNSTIDEGESVLYMLKELGLVRMGGGNYYIRLNGSDEELSFKKSDLPELVAEYRQELSQLLSAGWLSMPGQKDEVTDE